jgi:hypothetical protein
MRLTHLFVAYQYFSLLVSMQVCMSSNGSGDGAVNTKDVTQSGKGGGSAKEVPTEARMRA